ncbi:MAG: hypothetical protein WBA13_18175 [Microcoleaceae cyanobacterium]
MNDEAINRWVPFAIELLVLVGAVWKASAMYNDVKDRADRNSRDINRMGNSIREKIADESWVSQSQIAHIQEHLYLKDGYHAPTLRRKGE